MAYHEWCYFCSKQIIKKYRKFNFENILTFLIQKWPLTYCIDLHTDNKQKKKTGYQKYLINLIRSIYCKTMIVTPLGQINFYVCCCHHYLIFMWMMLSYISAPELFLSPLVLINVLLLVNDLVLVQNTKDNLQLAICKLNDNVKKF